MDIVVRIEDCQFTIIDGLVEGVEPGDVLDEVVVFLSLCGVSGLRVDVAQRGCIGWQRDNPDSLLVELDGVRQMAFGGGDFSQTASAR